MKTLALMACLSLMAATNEVPDLGVLTAENQIALVGAGYHFVVSFESLEARTNIFTLLNHRVPFVLRENVPPFMPAGAVRMGVHSVNAAGVASETNHSTFRILATAPRARLAKRYPAMTPPLPFMPVETMRFSESINLPQRWDGLWYGLITNPTLPGGTNASYAHRSGTKPKETR